MFLICVSLLYLWCSCACVNFRPVPLESSAGLPTPDDGKSSGADRCCCPAARGVHRRLMLLMLLLLCCTRYSSKTDDAAALLYQVFTRDCCCFAVRVEHLSFSWAPPCLRTRNEAYSLSWRFVSFVPKTTIIVMHPALRGQM